jgi:hypothetical protein
MPRTPSPKHLRDRFLGCPAAGHRLGSIADVALLGGGQDTSSEARAEALERRADPFDLDDVDAELGDASEGGIRVDADRSPGAAMAYSTVTDFARLRGWSTSVPRAIAT